MNRTLVGILISVALAAPAISAETEQHLVLTSLTVDFDGDGKMDRAELVLINPESADVAFNKNQYYMVGDSERVDLVLTLDAASGKPAFVKKKIVDPERVFMVSALESKSKGSLSVTSCYGCGAMKSWEETLTIAYRGGHFVVAGLSRGLGMGHALGRRQCWSRHGRLRHQLSHRQGHGLKRPERRQAAADEVQTHQAGGLVRCKNAQGLQVLLG